MPTHEQVGGRKRDKFVAIFYFLWLGYHGPDKVYDISQLLRDHPDAPQFGPVGAFHWWGRPLFDYYRSGDPWVIRRHATMLADAGVDVMVCDVTNAFTYDDTVKTLFETLAAMRAQGNATPAVAFIGNAHVNETVQKLYDRWYSKGLYKDLWFMWDGKPLVMADPGEITGPARDFFTFRRSWAFTGPGERKPGGWFADGKDRWPWIDNYPQNPGWHAAPDKPEAISVAVATHPIAGVGRSHTATQQPSPEQADPLRGTYFAAQWERALAVDPRLIFVTGWNEWVAQRFLWGRPAKVGFIGYKKPGEGDSYFVDQYDLEFSRDIEPMLGGYGDNYFMQLVANVRRFKGARSAPEPGKPKTINPSGDLAQWDDVSYAYRDTVGDAGHRDSAGFAKGQRLVNQTGRNDIQEAKVAYDAQNVYFYVRCTQPIEQPDGQTRLWLLINTNPPPAEPGGANDRRVADNAKTGAGSDPGLTREPGATHDPGAANATGAAGAAGRLRAGLRADRAATGAGGWAGFDRVINRRVQNGRAGIERLGGGKFAPRSMGTAAYQQAGRVMQIVIPRRLIVPPGRALRFDFKWADHLPEAPDPLDFLTDGDVAPNGRFAYRFDEGS